MLPAAVQNHLRRPKARFRPATASCGIRDPACLSGMSRATGETGAPTDASMTGSTRLGPASCSASLVAHPLTRLSRKLRGTEVQASYGIARHERSSESSPLNTAKTRSVRLEFVVHVSISLT